MSTKTISQPKEASRWDFLFKSTPAHGLAIFRIWFGLIMLWEMFYLIRLDFVDIFLTGPQVHFTYDILPFLRPMGETAMWGLIGILTICCVLIILGKWYRPAMATFAVGFTYVFLLDKAYYNNHLYLICLLAAWLTFIDADKVLALDAKKKNSTDVPFWMYAILIAQLFIVYFYGGLAKLNTDWLVHQEPVRLLIDQNGFLAALFGKEFAVNFIAYGGLIFDLSIGFLLIIPQTRKIGLVGLFMFNGTNAIMFDDINIFPYFMMGAAVIFLDQNWVKNTIETLLRKSESKPKKRRGVKETFVPSHGVLIAMGVYLVIQLLLPFRGHLFPGNIDWTGEGQRFSWRMKIQTRDTKNVEFQLMDYAKKTVYPINLKAYQLNRDQINLLSFDPAAVWQFGQFLKAHGAKKLKSKKVGVRSNILVSMNKRPFQKMIDSDTDIANEERSAFKHSKWIIPLKKRP